ncbi:MAG: hypothetical protein Q9171_001087 [Xanthocarpia ochracea]
MDELFLLPLVPLALPRAYWLNASERVMSSQVLLIQPSKYEYERVAKAIDTAGPDDYDMEIVNQLYRDNAMILPHRPYDLLTGEFRDTGVVHKAYMGSEEEPFDPEAILKEAKFLHFSDWPMPKILTMSISFATNEDGRYHQRTPTIPFARTSRHKPRRWPLALRFIKGAIHGAIIVPVFLHAAFAILIVALDHNVKDLGLPASIVFRNQTSYNRFWDGRNYLTVIITSVRNLTRSFLANSHRSPLADRAETDRIIRILIAILYATKNHLRAGWGAEIIPGAAINPSTGNATLTPEYSDLLPKGLYGCDDRGLGLVLQLTFFVEQYIKKGTDKEWFHAPQASQMQVQLNAMVDAYGKMETIRLTPIPIAHLIHQKQVLALFGGVLPFALVDQMDYWAILVVSLVMFTLYGIDGIGSQLEDPFGYDRNDIKMDFIVEDIRSEISVLLEEWKRAGEHGYEMFVGKGQGTGSGGIDIADHANGAT